MSYVKVRGFSGVACVVLGPEKVWEPCMCFVTDPETGEEFEEECPGEGEWVDGDGSRLRVVMVGDDHVYTVDADDCTPIDEDAFCVSCGQMGCMHGRSEE
jgi:hypothetical protein